MLMARRSLDVSSYASLWLLSVFVLETRPDTMGATHWTLDSENGLVVAAKKENEPSSKGGDLSESGHKSLKSLELSIFNILTNSPLLVNEDGGWVLSDNMAMATCQGRGRRSNFGGLNCATEATLQNEQNVTPVESGAEHSERKAKPKTAPRAADAGVNCGKPVNHTYVDEYAGISKRYGHPVIADPDTTALFTTDYPTSDTELRHLARRIQRQLQEKPQSSAAYFEAGNYWRIRGNATRAIDCYRRALSLSPNHSDVLLQLARVLMSLSYLEDAALLTRRSIDVQPSAIHSWIHQFTLGQILKEYGHYSDAVIHFKRTLQLRPGFLPAQEQLRELEQPATTSVTVVTAVIILVLVCGALWLIVQLSGARQGVVSDILKSPQRHFNRAMAMRSIKTATMRPHKVKKAQY